MSPYLTGRNAVLEAIKAGSRVRRVLYESAGAEVRGPLREVLDAARAANVAIERSTRSRLDAIHPRHQGIVAEVQAFSYVPFASVVERCRIEGPSALVLLLDELQDPQNLGTLLRTALAVKATAVVIPERRSAEVTPAVVRSSAGAAEHLMIARVPNLVRAIDDLKAAGLWVTGLDVQGGRPYDETDLSGPVALVVGSEGSGLRRLVRERCDLLVHLPMRGPTESLNAAVAGSIALYHVFRSRTRKGESESQEPG
jgi:23S rRNA (guanosine2251-2'-O)-methyltransferase